MVQVPFMAHQAWRYILLNDPPPDDSGKILPTVHFLFDLADDLLARWYLLDNLGAVLSDLADDLLARFCLSDNLGSVLSDLADD